MNLNPIETLPISSWHASVAEAVSSHATSAIERGQLLYLPQLVFELSPAEHQFLSPRFVDQKVKNISYDPRLDRLGGVCGTAQEQAAIKEMVARFASHAKTLIDIVLPHYRNSIQVARTSFRPAQVSNRKLSYRKDDKRLHVDAFPANPNQGRRILRVFSNINPRNEPRIWRIGEPFEQVAQRFLPKISRPFPGSSQLLQKLKLTKSRRTEYDHIMLQLHDRMKQDLHYQQQASQIEFHFPAYTSWIVQTDQVSHAAMSGQHLLEQTFYLPVEAMLNPQQSPLKILERLVGRSLV